MQYNPEYCNLHSFHAEHQATLVMGRTPFFEHQTEWNVFNFCAENQGSTVQLHVTDVIPFLHKSLRIEEIDIEKFLLRGKLLFLVQFKTVASTQRKL